MIPSRRDRRGPESAPVDGLGRRTREIDAGTGDEVECLELAPPLVANAAFVAALGERVARLAAVRHASYVPLRRLDRPAVDRLVLTSDAAPGWRLSQLLAGGLPPDVTVVIGVLRQLLPAVALFARHSRDAAIGTLSPERLIVTPPGRVIIAEYAFGPALDTLDLERERLWRELRVCLPAGDEPARATARGDAHAIGVVALSLLLGRTLADDEYPGQLAALVAHAAERREGRSAPLSPALSTWLPRALHLDAGAGFQSPHDAQIAFESVLAGDRTYVTATEALGQWATAAGSLIDGSREQPRDPSPVPAARIPDPVKESPADRPAVAAGSRRWLIPALIAVAAVQGSALLWVSTRDAGTPRAGEGELVVQSRPAAARVVIDGAERGVTPLTLTLPSGAHVLEVQVGQSEPRVIPLTIAAGAQTGQYIELQNVPTTGGLDVRSDPSGARVTVDGRTRGTTPLTIRELPPGEHQVVVEGNGRTVTQVLRIEAGATAQLVVPLPRR